MSKTFTVEVITPDRMVLSEKVISVVAPGALGSFGVLANHAPIMSELGIGHLDIQRADETRDAIAVSGGFVEVLHNKVTVLADTAELKGEIDVDRAESARRRAEQRLAEAGEEIDYERARAALLRAINRIKAASEN